MLSPDSALCFATPDSASDKWEEKSCGYHKDRASSVESGAVCDLPNVFNVIRVPTKKLFAQIMVCAFDGFCMAFKGTFSPSHEAIRGFDAYKQPTRRDTENLCS